MLLAETTSFLVFPEVGVVLVGLILGSFLSMLSWRLPQLEESNFWATLAAISSQHSKCLSCKKKLKWSNLIPLFSYLIQRGKCSHCNHKISIRYPLIEIITLFQTYFIWQVFANLPWELGFIWFVCGLFLITIATIDIEHRLVLDRLSLTLMRLGLIFSIKELNCTMPEAILGASIGYVCLWLVYQLHFVITKREGLGYGDFKLLAAIGAWVGIFKLPLVLLIASSLAIVYFVGLYLISKLNYFKAVTGQNSDKPDLWQTAIPFAPFLCFACWTMIYFIDFS